jgi:Uma2 family endonuclease
MRAVIADVPPQTLAWRRQTGNDRFDEMWEGVLHMAPAPSRSHQDILSDIYVWLRSHWARPRGNRVNLEVNLASPGGWPDNYRVPDLVLLTPDRFEIDRDVFFEGAPTVVVEIRSPGDETMEKLPFYAKLGVPEVWVVDRDTRQPDVYVLLAGHYNKQSPAADGWLRSAAAGIWLRAEAENRLAIQIAGDEGTRRILPES